MSNWVEEAFAPIAAANREAVMQYTWGHLAPQKNTTYRGKILTVKSGYGTADGKILDMKWDKLEDSPWVYDHINSWIWDIRETMKKDGVYLIEATMRNYRMWGKPVKVYSL